MSTRITNQYSLPLVTQHIQPFPHLATRPIKCPERIVKLAFICRRMPQFALFIYDPMIPHFMNEKYDNSSMDFLINLISIESFFILLLEMDRVILRVTGHRELNLRIQNYFAHFARNAFIKQVLQNMLLRHHYDNDSIDNFGISCSKMNLVGELGRSFFEFPNSFQKRREKPKKN
ncbi:Uncharacterized protein FWK35_00018424 [Aphis craccivora]|uniref:Uncharacterized protein n=1 Tax=Aphis craccivora TaxID=307492 RepID=A0A6G0Y6E0_APHCR|nr:Uncharacterized protein FWK35_00018424 [Aphis craccivora]